MTKPGADLLRDDAPAFGAPYAFDDAVMARGLLAKASLSPEREAGIDSLATTLIRAVRAKPNRIGGLDDVLREYTISSEEGLALMVMAETLLRVPDDATADRLIADKLAGSHWPQAGATAPPLVTASAWALGLGARVLQAGEGETLLAGLTHRIGTGAVRAAARQAMRVLGSHFVYARSIKEALRQAGGGEPSARFSFDMLGEGARTRADAERYRLAYADAITAIGRSAGTNTGRLGISVKLSALHPRYEARNRMRIMDEVLPAVADLARRAKAHDLAFTIDAEEADRLELSLAVVDRLLADPTLAGWDGFGLAVQAYSKRADAVLSHVCDEARRRGRRLMVRLVKGAYWDTEIKRAQERGLADYPVFTRKAMTDLNYIACARTMLGARDCLFPQFATHNALTLATIVAEAGGTEGYEFQRLHGMGESLYAALRKTHPDAACRIYAPVGTTETLLAYLVRRLLENGANSSFVTQIGDLRIDIESLLRRPQASIATAAAARSPTIPMPVDLHQPERRLAPGLDFGHWEAVRTLCAAMDRSAPAAVVATAATTVWSPIDHAALGAVATTAAAEAGALVRKAQAGWRAWQAKAPADRAACLERCADALVREAPRFLALLQREAGKVLEDAIGEWREAVDFCRYYAAQARASGTIVMPGPTGEENRYGTTGRGVFIAISPWNFPLSIFLGQVAAALVAGNGVIAKPAAQTPLVALAACRLLWDSGVPDAVLLCCPGDATLGAALVALPGIAGVVFTGSTGTGFAINRALAARDAPIVPLIAETGGINAMIVDATALPEQVCDDVVRSAFGAAGQRCSALRLLCLQTDVADAMIAMIVGAARELVVGDPVRLDTDIGPVIDAQAKRKLDAHIETMKRTATTLHAGHLPAGLSAGAYVAPHIFELGAVADLKEEVFGPILHVVRYRAGALGTVLDDLEATGFGLTLGIHSRIETTIRHIVERGLAGNIYVNRSMVGAVVGTQPFGGQGLSGTGPKAGGPLYLARFFGERVVSVNTAAVGINATLTDTM